MFFTRENSVQKKHCPRLSLISRLSGKGREALRSSVTCFQCFVRQAGIAGGRMYSSAKAYALRLRAEDIGFGTCNATGTFTAVPALCMT